MCLKSGCFLEKGMRFCHKNRIIYILIFLTAAGLLCFCPYPEKIDATLEGFYDEKNLLKLGAPGTIHIHRTHYHYCLREDVFKGGTSFKGETSLGITFLPLDAVN